MKIENSKTNPLKQLETEINHNDPLANETSTVKDIFTFSFNYLYNSTKLEDIYNIFKPDIGLLPDQKEFDSLETNRKVYQNISSEIDRFSSYENDPSIGNMVKKHVKELKILKEIASMKSTSNYGLYGIASSTIGVAVSALGLFLFYSLYHELFSKEYDSYSDRRGTIGLASIVTVYFSSLAFLISKALFSAAKKVRLTGEELLKQKNVAWVHYRKRNKETDDLFNAAIIHYRDNDFPDQGEIKLLNDSSQTLLTIYSRPNALGTAPPTAIATFFSDLALFNLVDSYKYLKNKLGLYSEEIQNTAQRVDSDRKLIFFKN